MLNSITCDTDPSAIIDMSDISSYIDTLEEVSSDYENNIKKSIIEEQSVGLSTSSFTIDNEALLYQKSNTVMDNCNIVQKCQSLIGIIQENLKDQRQKEISKLIEKIEEKLAELRSDSTSLGRKILQLTISVDEKAKLIEEKKAVDEEIEKYSKKLRVVEGMK